MNVLENYLNQLFQHNNKNNTINEQTLTIYNHVIICLEPPNTLHFLHSTNHTDQSEIVPFITNASTETTGR